MIKIITGVYGYRSGNLVTPKTPDDEPFELSPEQEARLVRLKVAEYVKAEPDAQVPTVDELPELPEGVEAIPEYNVSMKVDELRKIGATMGLTFKVGTSKAEMVAAMDAFMDENIVDDEESDGDELPDFDPSEAVQ